eukprot:3518455-Alexandrium_andersonii.AAC.1
MPGLEYSLSRSSESGPERLMRESHSAQRGSTGAHTVGAGGLDAGAHERPLPELPARMMQRARARDVGAPG